MIKEQIVSIFHKSTFRIIHGEYAGKATMVKEINFGTGEIVSPSGKRFLTTQIKPILKDIKTISLEEAEKIYRIYWGGQKTYEGPIMVVNFVDTGNKIYDIIRMFEGKDYVAGDRVEWKNVFEYCIENSIDCYDLIKTGEAEKL